MRPRSEIEPFRIGRRGFSQRAALATLSPSLLLAACQVRSLTEGSVSQPPAKELMNSPQEGDVVFSERIYNLLRNGRRYGISHPFWETYTRRTKFSTYGRKLYYNKPEIDIEKLTTGNGSNTIAVPEYLIRQMKNKEFGGEINVYFSGLLDDTAMPQGGRQTFNAIWGKDGLEAKGWGRPDSLFFPYSRDFNSETYDPKNTALDPKVNMQIGIDYIGALKEALPLVQFNLFGHSLGTLIALAAAVKHMDAINNLVLICGPVRGFKQTSSLVGEAFTAHTAIHLKAGIREEVSTYLFEIGEDKAYQESLDIFADYFVRSGRKLLVVASRDDNVIPVDSVRLKGATEIIESFGGNSHSLDMSGHISPLENKKVREAVTERIGVNYAPAA